MGQGSTLAQQRAALERQWERWVPDRSVLRLPSVPDSGVRSAVAASWLRSVRTVDPSRKSAPAIDSADIGARWEASPLREPVTRIAGQVADLARDAGYVAAVTDATGTILWTHGGSVMRRKAEVVNFAPGGRWDEPDMGTNALSLAMRTGEPSTVFSAEHLVAALHGWVCYCAPIHGPDGRPLGVLDLSSTWDRSNPLALSMVRSLVTNIETMLRAEARPAAGIRLNCLGGAALTRDGRRLPLRPRQLEILALLALEPDGFTPERLHHAVYGDRPAVSSTLKADVSHLRRTTGGRITNRVYRLTAPLACDAVEVLTALAAGDVDTALRLYRGPLLPGSETPGVVAWREHLEVAVRTAVLAAADPEHALRYGERAPEDLEIHEHALRLLPPGDGRRAVAAARCYTANRS